jgi:tRNA(fMet)-specific endonuclease VapC
VHASGERRADRQSSVDDIIESLPIIAYDTAVAIEHAKLLLAVHRAGRPRGAHVLIVAAAARARNRTVVTADRAAFAGLPSVATYRHRRPPQR